jgi:pilus assembly protein Flp/PilA
MNIMKRLWQEEEGQDLVEYGLLIVLISLLSVVAMKGLASSISNAFAAAATQLNSTT